MKEREGKPLLSLFPRSPHHLPIRPSRVAKLCRLRSLIRRANTPSLLPLPLLLRLLLSAATSFLLSLPPSLHYADGGFLYRARIVSVVSWPLLVPFYA